MQLMLKSFKYQTVPYMLFFSESVKVLTISTVRLLDDTYETCYFYHTDDKYSEVFETYDSFENAIDGHRRHCIINGIKPSGQFAIIK